MNTTLRNKKIAILAADGFEQVELEGPMEALKTASADVRVISLKAGQIVGMNHTDKGTPIDVDLTLEEADEEEFDGLMIPGGLYNPDTLRSTPAAVEFTRRFAKAGKPIAAICHGPWLLIEAGISEGRRMTSWPAIRTDVENAGAEWVDEEVVVDQGIVTSRQPEDIPAFNRKMIEEFAEGIHSDREK